MPTQKWDSGALLARFAAGQDWEPLSIPIRGPSARQIGERLAEARQWAAEWAAACGPLRVDYKQVGGRHFGANSIPCRAWLDGYDEAWAPLKVEFAAAPDGITRAYVIENEITYLAFPVPAAAMAILGGGYAVPVLEPLGWLTGLDVVYWGDIDTHGFAILNRPAGVVPWPADQLAIGTRSD